MLDCGNCKSPLPHNSAFCPRCGAKLVSRPAPTAAPIVVQNVVNGGGGPKQYKYGLGTLFATLFCAFCVYGCLSKSDHAQGNAVRALPAVRTTAGVK